LLTQTISSRSAAETASQSAIELAFRSVAEIVFRSALASPIKTLEKKKYRLAGDKVLA
jgi:hypothetical protein